MNSVAVFASAFGDLHFILTRKKRLVDTESVVTGYTRIVNARCCFQYWMLI